VLWPACGISARWRARRGDHMRSTLPPQSLIRTSISTDAYRAIAVSSMRLLLEQGGSQGGYFFCLDQLTLSKLMAAKRRSEDFSDVMIRMAKVDATAKGRLSLASNRLSLQAPAVYRH
jgi:hypothetical protein